MKFWIQHRFKIFTFLCISFIVGFAIYNVYYDGAQKGSCSFSYDMDPPPLDYTIPGIPSSAVIMASRDNLTATDLNARTATTSPQEHECLRVMTTIFQQPFVRCRPQFLFNDITGKCLELDVFNEDLKLGVEFQGRQHYEYTPHFHSSKQDFYNQRYRDKIKRELCEKNKITLIEVPYNISLKKIHDYLVEKLKDSYLSDDAYDAVVAYLAAAEAN